MTHSDGSVIIDVKFDAPELKAGIDKLREIKNEQKLLNSEFENTKTKYATVANSMEALNAKAKNYSDIIANLKTRQEQQKSVVEQSHEAIVKYTGEVDKLHAEYEQLIATYGKDSNEAKKKNAELNKTVQYLQSAQQAERGYAIALDATTIELREWSVAQDKNNKYIGEAEKSVDGMAKSIDQYGNEVEKSSDSMTKWIAGFATVATAKKAVDMLVGAIKDCANAAIEFETSMTGVRKTVDGTPEQLKEISDGVREMALEIPLAAAEIGNIAAAAGQLGIKTDDILDFTRVIADLGVATNLTGEEAAMSLAKFANVTQMAAEDYDNLGNVIVRLGNNFSTTEKDIVDMAMGIASAGTQIGLSVPDIMGVATAISSVGMEAQAGGSAVSRILNEIDLQVKTSGEKLGQYAQVAGVSAEEFSKAWGENAVDALGMFLAGLSDVERNGKTSIEILEEMGITEIRTSDAVRRLSGAIDLMRESQEMANGEWVNGNALAAEAETAYGTTANQIELMKNSVNDLKISIGDAMLPVIKDFAGWVEGLTGKVREFNEAVQKANDEQTQGFIATVNEVSTLYDEYDNILSKTKELAESETLTSKERIDQINQSNKLINDLSFTITNLKDELAEIQEYGFTNPNLEAAIESLTKQRDALKVSTNDLRNAEIASNEIITDSITAINNAAKANSDYLSSEEKTQKGIRDQINETSKTREEANKALSLALKNLQQAQEDAKNGLISPEELDAVRKEYDDLSDSIRECDKTTSSLSAELMALISEFGEVSDEVSNLEEKFSYLSDAAHDLMSDLLEQSDDLTTYAENLQTAAEIGIEEGLIKQWANGSEASKKFVATAVAEYNRLVQIYGVNSQEVIGYLNQLNSAFLQVNAASEVINNYTTTAAEKAEELAKIQEKAAREAETAARKSASAAKAAAKEIADADKEMSKAIIDNISEVQKAIKDLTKEYESAYKSAYNSTMGQLDLFAELTGAASDAFKIDVKALRELTDGLESGAMSSIDELLNGIKKSSEESEIYVSQFVQSISKLDPAVEYTFDELKAMFESTSEETSKVTDTMMENMRNHAKEVAKYNEDLNRAMELGFSDGFVSTLTDGSEESKKALKSILDEYDSLTGDGGLDSGKAVEFVDEFNDAFADTEYASGTLAHTMAEMQTHFTDRATELIDQAKGLADGISSYTGDSFKDLHKKMSETMSAIADMGEVKGSDMINGLIQGINYSKNEAIDDVKDLATGIDTAFSDTLDINSPSKVFYDHGADTLQGLINAIKDMSAAAFDVIGKLASGVDESYTDTLKIDGGTSLVFEQNGIDTIQGLINGIESKRADAVGAIGQLAQDMITKFREVMEIHSPSQVAEHDGEMIPLGVAGGVRNETGAAVAAVADMGKAISSELTKISNLDYNDMLDYHSRDMMAREAGDNSAWARNFMIAAVAESKTQEELLRRLKEIFEKFGLMYMDFVDIGHFFEWEGEWTSVTAMDGFLDMFRDKMYEFGVDTMKANGIFANMFESFDVAPPPELIEAPWFRARKEQQKQIRTFHEETKNMIVDYQHTFSKTHPGGFEKEAIYGDVVLEFGVEYSYGETMEEYKKAMEIARAAYEAGGGAWEAYQSQIEQQEKVIELEKQLQDQIERMRESASTNEDGGVTYAAAAITEMQDLSDELENARAVLTATTLDFERLTEAIDTGTVESFTRLVGASEEADAVIIEHATNLQTVADTQERIAELQDEIASKGFIPNSLQHELDELIPLLQQAQNELTLTTEAITELEETLVSSLTDASEEASKLLIRDVRIHAADMKEWGEYAAQMLAEGIQVGVYDEYGNVIDALKFFTEGIKETIQDGLDIHSPSRFGKWIGAMLPAGIAIGVEDNLDVALKSVRHMTDSIAEDMDFFDKLSARFNGVDIEAIGAKLQGAVLQHTSGLANAVVGNSYITNTTQGANTYSPTYNINADKYSLYDVQRMEERRMNDAFYR